MQNDEYILCENQRSGKILGPGGRVWITAETGRLCKLLGQLTFKQGKKSKKPSTHLSGERFPSRDSNAVLDLE